MARHKKLVAIAQACILALIKTQVDSI